MQLNNILLAGLAAAASVSARTTPSARRYAAPNPGCRIVPASDLNFGVADLTSGTVVTKVLTFPKDINIAFTASELGGFFVQVGDQCN
ncbi:hypothetical protein ColTof3_07886 [Colletotrichum tofieldiae]|nr:hypothetical protein ColTof3_07886 [Colletotrichum tofieldiae]